MKIFTKLSAAALALVCVGICNHGNAQGTGNHVTMSLENCTQPTANTMEFDVLIMSDGASNSDLRVNPTQFGINYNSGILQSEQPCPLPILAAQPMPFFRMQ